MTLHLFNSLTHTKVPFTPLDPSKVKLYVCGPTVYARPHIGNARAMVVYDVLYRLLCHLYGKEHVLYVRNITDVDDKINQAATQQGRSIYDITTQMTAYFHQDMGILHCLKPMIEPKVTDHISEVIAIIERILERGHAYLSNGHVYFSVESFKAYGALSNRSIEEMIVGNRIDQQEEKRDPKDFVLWKPASKHDDVSSVFESPWGKGRPGWHIECSAMSCHYLGHTFDIHGGGADLTFPHHENEIAQSVCAYPGSSFARYWVHNGFLTVGGEKMSKSLGNFFTVNDLIEQGLNGNIVRYVLLSTHYRKPLDWNHKVVGDAKKFIERLVRLFSEVSNTPLEDVTCPRICLDALYDDMQLAVVFRWIHEQIKAFHKESALPKKREIASLIRATLALMGFDVHALGQSSLSTHSSDEIEALINERAHAKQEKNYARADAIRDQLLNQGVRLEDHTDGTTSWYK